MDICNGQLLRVQLIVIVTISKAGNAGVKMLGQELGPSVTR